MLPVAEACAAAPSRRGHVLAADHDAEDPVKQIGSVQSSSASNARAGRCPSLEEPSANEPEMRSLSCSRDASHRNQERLESDVRMFAICRLGKESLISIPDFIENRCCDALQWIEYALIIARRD